MTLAIIRSPFVATAIAHLACKQMLGLLDADVTIGLVDLDCVLKALCNLLCQTDLLFGHQFVWQTLWLGAFSTFLCL